MATHTSTSAARPSSQAGLPTGTLTFLFTDIEASTRLLAQLGERYEQALARHNEILRNAIAQHDGLEVSTEGDAFFTVFRSAPQAVAAAVSAQRAVSAEKWSAPDAAPKAILSAEDSAQHASPAANNQPRRAPIRVRMGLHSGEGRLGGDNYAGLDVNRAARIAAAGHGGQVLISDATRALVTHELPEGVALEDLGQHRLKDLPAPEHIWQLTIEGLPADFGPLRSLDARPNNLPLAPTSLIGREQELDEIVERLGHTRLLTLTGPGGAGKTRLALAAAHRLVSDFGDGAFFVALADTRDVATVTAAIASALGIREKPDRSFEEGLAHFLRERELLLVLDNFEHVLDAAPLVAELVAATKHVRVIVTSRELLHLSGEHGFDVPPLRLPAPGQLPPLAALSQYEAVALFIERAVAVKPDFAVTNDNAPAVAEICNRLDGLPLAIELAAARVRMLPPQAILERLERRLPLLTGGPRDVPDRQRTLRGAIDWSHDLLDGAERQLFARLSVFAGGWTLAAAEAVCNPANELGVDTLDGLTSLADKSLVRPTDSDDATPSGTEPRFRMLQVIREYAAERLEADPEAPEIRARHARQVLALAEEAEPQLLLADVRRWQRRLRGEEDNFRAALGWALDTGDADAGLRTAAALWRYWHYWAQLREGRRWLESLLELPGAQAPTLARAKALSGLAGILYWQGETDRVSRLYEEALAIYRELGDVQRVAEGLYDLAWGALVAGDPALATQRAEEALEHFRRSGDIAGATTVKGWLVTTPYFMGTGGNLDEALAAVRETIEVNRRHGRIHVAADWLAGITQTYAMVGEYGRAAEALRDALRHFVEMGNVGLYPMVIKGMASLELRQGRPESAVRLAAAAARFFDELGGEMKLGGRLGDPLEEARSEMAEEDHARALAEGRTMSLDEAVALTLEERREGVGGNG